MGLKMAWQFWIDRGGTFTDIVARDPQGGLSTKKLLSENPERYQDAAIAGIREFLGLDASAPIPPGAIASVKMGTTVATNALLERKGARTLLIVNKGFADLLRIGTQARPHLFDLNIRLPSMLYARVAELPGRVSVNGEVIEQPDDATALALLMEARQQGFEAVAIALIHAWKYPALEERLGRLAAQAGFGQISLSHIASPLLRLVPRADTTVADAYLSPVLGRYIRQFSSGLSSGGQAPALYFMQSHGGLARATAFTGKDAILSGPAGGIVGAVRTAAGAGFDKIIGFDMGGTSTDVALYDGAFQRTLETELAGVRLRAPMLAINTVAAGGGSILSFDGARLRVGPESAGANPGPACYRKGGPLTVTDANLLLGKILPTHFPAIFGPNGDQPLDAEIVRQKFTALAKEVAQATDTDQTPERLAEGFLAIANANMAQAIRQISIQKGLNPADFTLVCFGGAGGQHACAVADELGMERVFLHPLAGVLSAYGIGLSDFLVMREQGAEIPFTPEAVGKLTAIEAKLSQEAETALRAQNPGAKVSHAATILLRYAGTDTALPIKFSNFNEMEQTFTEDHQRLFGFASPGRALVADMVLVEATAPGESLTEPAILARASPEPLATSQLVSGGKAHAAPVYNRAALGAGAQIPGPACYRKGGPLTVTDANLLLGKILPAHFPAIFGPNGDQPLDAEIGRQKFTSLAEEVTQATGTAQTPARLAEGFLAIANANMAQAIRQISIQKGLNPADFTLVCFGGAGGQHACAVADELGMERVFLHPLAGVLSAYGIGLSDLLVMREQGAETPFTPEAMDQLAAIEAKLAQEAETALRAQNPGAAVSHATTILLRYAGTDSALPIKLSNFNEMEQKFTEDHQRLFGFATPGRPLIADTVLVEATAPGEPLAEPAIPARALPQPLATSQLVSGGKAHKAPVYNRAALGAGAQITGPAILQEAISTIIVEPGWRAEITAHNHCILHRIAPRENAAIADATKPGPVLLELFANLFMAVAEQAGAVLRNTAQSVNIKERLDFSCAIFDADGNLVANAPHVPVHLGAMGASVRHVLVQRGQALKPGDAIALNNPYAGGTHLPDITVITPVFDETGRELRFFTACRGHHADIGGLTPGSTPPFSKILEEEGVVLDNFLILSGGQFQEDGFRTALGSARYPARNPDQNVADIKAQIAANATAAQALGLIVARYGWSVVQAYMGHVMNNAEAATRAAIRKLRDAQFDYTMDDGTTLKISLKINHDDASAVVDFTGTSPAGPNNFNAPRAVTTAAVLYAFRCLAGTNLPLNEGCLKPLTIIVPEGSFLAPPPGAAVVAGNTEVSQAVTVALLGAMGVCASAQATMNNFLFGNAKHQYYETICGGAGAGPGFNGCSAVHTHMTNTRITDPEVLELRHPVRVEAFSIRRGSGGAGKFCGGDGVVRKIRFLEPMTATITASRRTQAPFGLEGGAPGAMGGQFIEHADGTLESLPGRAEAALAAGEAIIIHTPGGGGYGAL